MSKLQLVKLDTTSVQLVDGDRGINYPSKKDFSDKGYCLFLDSSNLTKNGFDFSTTVFIDKKKDQQMSKGHLQRGDLVINTRGTIGNIGYYSDDVPFENIRINSGMLILRGGSDYANRFLYFYLRSSLVFSQIDNLMSGSVQNQLPIWIIKFLKLPKIHLKQQNKISDVLSAIDAKIDLNNRINAELEAMAKTLYDYWFVQFDFPFDFAQGKSDKNGKPYKSSGGKMIWNKELKREIPVGWKDSNILAVAELLGGGTPTKIKPEYWNGNIPFFTPSDADGTIFKFATEDYITEKGLKKSSTKLFEKDTVFITARGSVGKLILAGTKMAMNQSCYALRSKTGISHTFLYFLTKELIHHLEVKSSGSVFNSIVSNDIEFTNLAIPDSTLVEKFAAVVEPAFARIANNTRENQHLSSLRDWLLPMLMNGQVKVG